jgi:hypothetical protein
MRTRTKSRSVNPNEGKETKEQKKARIQANKEAQEMAVKVIVPAVGGAFLLFVFVLFWTYGFGKTKTA